MQLTKRGLMALATFAALPVPALGAPPARRAASIPLGERALIERACERLIVEYTHLVDHGEAARVADLFTADGAMTALGSTMSGRAASERVFRSGKTIPHECPAIYAPMRLSTCSAGTLREGPFI